ncbi:CUB and zona pellucida-like domain-containing protein 1 [Danio aesculapii]|uniref:CUB and zona pellucida-like domain-containing protein 1 n=1 Tax=Danio aesculapii TaxID=1142201 RepID=UPI0024C05AF4|nr:CUB and zona pellucida-like domain-containing protein 1 [Danio aesculapii]
MTPTTTIITSTAPTILPLSKIPLQFSFQVGSLAPSCVEGQYLPQFLYPTPLHGELLQARVNHEFEIRVNAVASFSRIIDVIISGPLNSTKTKATTGEYVVNWTPTQENYGQHFPFCFIAEAQHMSDIYQSEMRCVVAEVVSEGPVAHVTCSANSMSVTILRSSIQNLRGDQLRLIDPSCQLYSNSTDVYASTPLDKCGTTLEETNNELIFKNKVVTFADPQDIKSRNNNIEIEIICTYQKNADVSQAFDTHKSPIKVSEKSFGTLNYHFEFYPTNSFQNMTDPSAYPLEYDVGDMIYMKIQPDYPVTNTELFLESCMATPYDTPNYPVSYPIITNGCNMDETVQFFSSHQPYVEFEMAAFKFTGFQDQVFISCSIIVCQTGVPNTRCSQGCINSTVAPPSHNINKRDAPIQTSNHFISQGPIRLRRSPSQVTVNLGLNVNLAVVAGCLVAITAMICAVIVYTSKTPRIRRKSLPSNDF